MTIELYSPDPLPVALAVSSFPTQADRPGSTHCAVKLHPGHGLTAFVADADRAGRTLNFKLSPDVGLILLSAPDLAD
jgi:hypothetical protein